MNRIGFSVIVSSEKSYEFYKELLSSMLQHGCDAIELHFPEHTNLALRAKLLPLIKEFTYRSIHTTDITSARTNKTELAYYIQAAHDIQASAITIHPHTMKTWKWLDEYFGTMTSFENMDWRKPFGTSVSDMQQVLRQFPSARWTFDVNHIYTNDPSIQLAEDFKNAFSNLGHYHVSGFQDKDLPHTTLYTTRQKSIIDAVTTNHPIIIESFGLTDIIDFKKEYAYIEKALKRGV